MEMQRWERMLDHCRILFIFCLHKLQDRKAPRNCEEFVSRKEQEDASKDYSLKTKYKSETQTEGCESKK